jgi:Flp pilus assembly protein CpaB
MKPKTMILMGLAIVCGLGASYMTSRLLAERQAPEDEKVEILVAKKPLSVGERMINPEDFFERKAVVKADEPPDAIKDFDQIKGKVMRSSRNRGDHITAANLLDKNRLDIPEGTQAVGLPVNLMTTLHGLATLPGSRVDVILTVRHNDINNTFAKTIVRNVLVLAADGRVTPEGEIIAPASVVTVALNNKDMLIANAAKEMGILTLSLRKLDDDSKAELDTIDGRTLLNGPKKEEPKVAVAPAPKIDPTPVVQPPEGPKGTPGTLEIVSGNSVQTTKYRRLDNGDVEFDDGTSYSAPPLRTQPRPQQQQQPAPAPKGGSSREF